MVRNAFGEMRRYYSRKVIDVLIKVTRISLDALKRKFTIDPDNPEGIVNTKNQNFFNL